MVTMWAILGSVARPCCKRGMLLTGKLAAYQKALDFQPDWVFIKLGTNDTKPVNRVFLNEYMQDYKDLIASFRQLSSHPRVVLLLPVPVFSTDTTGITASVVREKTTADDPSDSLGNRL